MKIAIELNGVLRDTLKKIQQEYEKWYLENPFKEDEDESPWRDLIFQEEGRVLYNGDNKSSEKNANDTFGNKKVLEKILLVIFSQ